ncbi:MAG: DUF2905 domain-containing protein [Methyloceanibacter sp.]
MKSISGLILFLLAVAALTFASVRFGLGRLPGDIVVDRGDFVLYLPFTTAVIVSLVLSLVLWLVGR